MAQLNSLQPGDRVKVTRIGHTRENEFGNVEARSDARDVVWVVFDGYSGSSTVYEADVTKVASNAGKPKPDVETIMTRDERTHALGAYAAYLLAKGTEPQEFSAKLYNAADEWKLL